MKEKSEKSLKLAGELHRLVREMIPQVHDLDLQRLLKQIEADMMDLEHKLSMAIKLSSRE
ncbi:MAG: hypothetical protein JSU85_04035 [Candidatus Zixiibacteriota bacterium]|nr:MAG: hypothetical protein JSU85_04035 [candidate division Zixibacteria bacterium]